MAQIPKPTVSPSPDAIPFWEGAKRNALMLPFCRACSTHFFYPRTACPHCGSRDTEWVQASGRGKLYSFCIHHNTGIKELRDAVPFVTAMVTLDEGPRMMAYLIGVDPDPARIKCDMPVEVSYVESANGYRVPAFRPELSPR